jgi:hypothetical protein
MSSSNDDEFIATLSSFVTLVGFAISLIGGITFVCYRMYKCYRVIKNRSSERDIEDFISSIKENVTPISP